MKRSKATAALFLDTRKAKAPFVGTVHVMVNFQRVTRLYSTGVKVTREDWEKLDRYKGNIDGRMKDENFRSLHSRFYGKWLDATGHEREGAVVIAQKVIDSLGEDFSFDAFKNGFSGNGKGPVVQKDRDDALQFLRDRAVRMKEQGRIGTALNYDLTAKSLRRFLNFLSNDERKALLLPPPPCRRRLDEPFMEERLSFSAITPNFLLGYEDWMLNFGKAAKSPKKGPQAASMTTIGIYLRHLRAVLNEAKAEGLLKAEQYPFGRHKYIIPAGTNTKKALDRDDIEKIMGYPCSPGTLEQRSRDLWVFSYLSNGMNLADICSLRWADIETAHSRITFTRQKTARSRKANQTRITAFLFNESWAIIQRWGNQDQSPSSLVFPFVSPDCDAERRKRLINQIIKVTNKWMNRIAEAVGIEMTVNTYTARHSFATILLREETPLGFISQALGHSDIKTTQSYLGSFKDEQAKTYLSVLLRRDGAGDVLDGSLNEHNITNKP